MRADQLMLAGVVAVGVDWLGVSKPAASAAGYVGEESLFGASCDVGPGITPGAVSVAASDVTAVGGRHVISPDADASHTETMATMVKKGQQLDHGWVTPRGLWGIPHRAEKGTRQ